MAVEIEPPEAKYLIACCQHDRTIWVGRMGDGIAHADILRRDYAATQIERLDALILKLEAVAPIEAPQAADTAVEA